MTGSQRLAVTLFAALALPTSASAQVLGTFRWQLQPYCNLVTLVVTQVGGVYRVEGTDNQCGAATSASVTGTAIPNPDGSIGLGLNVVATGGTASPVDATIAVANLSGTWRGYGATSGAFVFTPGPPMAGSPRPLPGTAAVPPAIALLADGSLLARTSGDGAIPTSGPGSRMMWYASKAAFPAGRIDPGLDAARWDDAAVGLFSTALGLNTWAGGIASVAAGDRTSALGRASMALGSHNYASGLGSVALGDSTEASGDAATALGYHTSASGVGSMAMGSQSIALGEASTAIGSHTYASGPASFAGGTSSATYATSAFAFGHYSSAYGPWSVALGSRAQTGGSAAGSFVLADHSSDNAFKSDAPNEFGARFAGGFYLYTKADLSTGVARWRPAAAPGPRSPTPTPRRTSATWTARSCWRGSRAFPSASGTTTQTARFRGRSGHGPQVFERLQPFDDPVPTRDNVAPPTVRS